MPGPIGYVPPANPYNAMPIEEPKFTGLNPLPAMGAAQAAMAPMQAQINQSIAHDTQAAKAAQFQKLLTSGQEGMQAYIQDVAKTQPELAQQFSQEFQTMAPFMQNLKGKELTDFAFNTYDSWNGRYSSKKLGTHMQENTNATMPELLNQAGGSLPTEKMLSLKDSHDLKQTQMALNKSKIDWNTQRPQLMRDLEATKAKNRERMQHVKLSTAGKAKLDPAVARNNLSSIELEIGETRTRIAAMEQAIKDDPMIASIHQVPSLLKGYQSVMKELMDDREEYQKALGASAATAGTAGGTGTTTTMTATPMAKPTATSTYAEVETFMRRYRNKNNEPITVNDATVKSYMEKLKAAGTTP